VTPTTSDLHYARRLRDYLRLGVSARPAACLCVLADPVCARHIDWDGPHTVWSTNFDWIHHGRLPCEDH
jgi:hypothetical protein